MEIKINKDMSEYKEKYMGLSLKQLICGGLSVGLSVGMYFLTNEKLPEQIVTWLCILVATPSAAIGFFTYNGMTCWQFLKVFFRHYLTPETLFYKSYNLYESYLDFYKNLKPKERMNKNGN